jgi:hypothetical protein
MKQPVAYVLNSHDNSNRAQLGTTRVRHWRESRQNKHRQAEADEPGPKGECRRKWEAAQESPDA